MNLQNEYIKMNELAANTYHHILLNTEVGDKAYTYLQGRGFIRETMERYQLGFSYKGNIISKKLSKQGFNLDDGLRNGLLKKSKSEDFLDVFISRVMIPIRDEYGNLLGFSGRILPGNTHPAKYLNTGDTPIFEKGNFLFNLDFAKKSIREKNCVILYEGYFDSITSSQHGLHNVVSSMGTFLTDVQVNKLKKLTNRIIVCLDGDKAGMNAAKRNGEMLMEKGFDVRIALIENGDDPHDYIVKNGIHAFVKDIVANAIPFISFYRIYLKMDLDMSVEVDKLQYANKVLNKLPQMKHITDEEKNKIMNELIAELDISSELLIGVFKQAMRK